MPARAPEVLTAAGSFTQVLAPGDTDLFLGVSPTAGSSYGNLSFKVEGTRDVAGIWYDIALHTTDFAGPLAGPVKPVDNAAVAYYGDCRLFAKVRVTVVTVGGSATFELRSGSFLGSPPQRVIGAGGTMTVQGTVGLTAGTTGDVRPAAEDPEVDVALVRDERVLEALERVLLQLEALDHKLAILAA